MSPHLSQPDTPCRHPLPVTWPHGHPPPHTRHIAMCLACTLLLRTSQLHGHVTTPLQPHTPPHCCLHMLPPLQPHTPHHHMPCSMAISLPPSQSHTSRRHVPHCCTGHVAPLTAAHVTSPHTLSLHGLRHPPRSCTCCIAVHLAATWASSPPPLQLHTLPRTSQLHGPCCRAPCSCTPYCCPPCSVGTWAY